MTTALELLLSLTTFYGILWSLTFAHEAGHLLAARLLGLPILEFRVGAGWQLATWVWEGVRIRLHLGPRAGVVRIGHFSARYWVNMVFVLAGPAAEYLFLWALVATGTVAPLAGLFLLALSAWYQRPRKLEGGLHTDADLVIRLTRKRLRRRSFT